MSDDYQRIELITGAVRRRHWTTEQKLQIIEESFQAGETVSSVDVELTDGTIAFIDAHTATALQPTLPLW